MSTEEIFTTALGTTTGIAVVIAAFIGLGKNTLIEYIKNTFQLHNLARKNDFDTYKIFLKDELDKQNRSIELASKALAESQLNDHSLILQERIKAINHVWKEICVFNEFSNIIIAASIAPINNDWNKTDFNLSMVKGTGRDIEDILQIIQKTKTSLLESQLLIPIESYKLISNFIKIYMLCALKTQFCINNEDTSDRNLFTINDKSILDTLSESTKKDYSFGIDGEIITGMNDLLDLISEALRDNISFNNNEKIKSLELVSEFQKHQFSEYLKNLDSKT
jgi:hypothetical protein